MRKLYLETKFSGEVAQSVERETENLCVGGSIPSLAIPSTIFQVISRLLPAPSSLKNRLTSHLTTIQLRIDREFRRYKKKLEGGTRKVFLRIFLGHFQIPGVLGQVQLRPGVDRVCGRSHSASLQKDTRRQAVYPKEL